jgi:hypothetical protein
MSVTEVSFDEALRLIQTSLISCADEVKQSTSLQESIGKKGETYNAWDIKILEILFIVAIEPSDPNADRSSRPLCTDRSLWDDCSSKCDGLLKAIELEYSLETRNVGDIEFVEILRKISGLVKECSKILTTNNENKTKPNPEKATFPTDSVIVFDSSSAFFKPRRTIDDETDRSRSLMSPVLGTEALYRQAGWLTPVNDSVHNQDHHPSSSSGQKSSNSTIASETVAGSGSSPRKPGQSPSLDMGALLLTEDGGSLGSQTATQTHGDEDVSERHSGTKHDESDNSKAVSSLENKSSILGQDDEEYDDDDEDDIRDQVDANETETETNFPVGFFPIPTSSREIYSISNRNRRVKKNGSPPIDRIFSTPSANELEELAKAEEILRNQNIADGKPYSYLFDDGNDGQQTAGSFREQDDSYNETGSNDYEEDLAFIKEIGWIQSDEEISSLLKVDLGDNKNSEHSTGTGGADS